jgi:hypothetical protein
MTSNNRLEEDEVVPLSSFIMLRDKNIPSFPYWAMPLGKDYAFTCISNTFMPKVAWALW